MPQVTTALSEVGKVVEALKKAASKYGATTADVEVGYSAFYALWVHECHDMKLYGWPRRSGKGVYWGPTGRSNFLLGPAHSLENIWASAIKSALKQGKTLAQALLIAGNLLLRESKKQVPVEYGELKRSGFVKLLDVKNEVDE